MYSERSRFMDVDYNEVSDAAKGLIQEYFKIASKAPIHETTLRSGFPSHGGKPVKQNKRKVRSKVRPGTKCVNNVCIKLDTKANSDIAVFASGFAQATSKEYNVAPNKPLRNFSAQGTIAKPSNNLRVMLEEHRQESEGNGVFPIPQSKSIPLKSKSNAVFRPVDDAPITDELGDEASRPSTPAKPIPTQPQAQMLSSPPGSGQKKILVAKEDYSRVGGPRPASSNGVSNCRRKPADADSDILRPKTAGLAPRARARSPRTQGKSGAGAGDSTPAQRQHQRQRDSTDAQEGDANLAADLPVLMTLVQGQLQKYIINREIVPAVDFDTTFQTDQRRPAKAAGKPNWLSLARKIDDSTDDYNVDVGGAGGVSGPRPATTGATGSLTGNRAWSSPGRRRQHSPGRARDAGTDDPPTLSPGRPLQQQRPTSPTTATVTLKNQVRNVLSNISHEVTLNIDNSPSHLNVTYTNANANILNDNGHNEPTTKTLFTTTDRIQQQRLVSAPKSRKNEQVVYDNGVDIINSLTDLIQKSRHSDWLVRSRTFQEAMRLIQQAKDYNDSSAAYIAYQILRSHGEYAAMYEQQVQVDSYCTANSYQAAPRPVNITAVDGTGANEMKQNEVVRYRRDPSSLFNGKETRVIKEFSPMIDTGPTPGTNTKLITAKLFNKAYSHAPQKTQAQHTKTNGHGGSDDYDHGNSYAHPESLQLAEMTLESDKVNLSPRSAGAGSIQTPVPHAAMAPVRAEKGPSRPLSAPAVRRSAPAAHRAVKHMAQCVL